MKLINKNVKSDVKCFVQRHTAYPILGKPLAYSYYHAETNCRNKSSPLKIETNF